MLATTLASVLVSVAAASSREPLSRACAQYADAFAWNQVLGVENMQGRVTWRGACPLLDGCAQSAFAADALRATHETVHAALGLGSLQSFVRAVDAVAACAALRKHRCNSRSELGTAAGAGLPGVVDAVVTVRFLCQPFADVMVDAFGMMSWLGTKQVASVTLSHGVWEVCTGDEDCVRGAGGASSIISSASSATRAWLRTTTTWTSVDKVQRFAGYGNFSTHV